jgi:flagellar FliL protein
MADQTQDTGGGAAGGIKQSDAMIDTSETSRGAQKVELDLEDAPFLEEEEEVKPEPPKPTEAVPFETEEEKPSGLDRKKKLIIIGAAALVALIAVVVAVKVLFFKGKTAPAPEPTKHEAPKEAANATAAAPELPEIQVRLEPFWVEQKGEGDEVRFLIVRILLTTTSQGVAKDLQLKLMPARNAIFYYLKNKDVQFLADEHNAEKLKTELLLVINQYVTDGKFDNLMFEEYVVK